MVIVEWGFWFAIIGFINLIICNVIFDIAFSKDLKNVSPGIYDKLFGKWPIFINHFKVWGFAFLDRDTDDTNEIRKIRKYLKLFCILNIAIAISIFLLPLLLMLMLVFIFYLQPN